LYNGGEDEDVIRAVPVLSGNLLKRASK